MKTESVAHKMEQDGALDVVEGFLSGNRCRRIIMYLFWKQNGQPLYPCLNYPAQVSTYEKLSAVSGIPTDELKEKLKDPKLKLLINNYRTKTFHRTPSFVEVLERELEGVELNFTGLQYLRESRSVEF